MKPIQTQLNALLATDPGLQLYASILRKRIEHIYLTAKRLTSGKTDLTSWAAGHEYFGLHFRDDEWVFREWAPNATEVYLIGDVSEWRAVNKFALSRITDDGVWEIRLPASVLKHRDLYRLHLKWPGGHGDRVPAYARRTVQDQQTLIFNAQVWRPQSSFQWRMPDFRCSPEPLLIYEAHVGMAQEAEKVGTYREFTQHIISRIVKAGYNTIQLMAVQEHPYYGSFGYQVSSFFAASSRYGTPEDLKELIDTAHVAGLRVIMDVIHSHAVKNEAEGLSHFDGTRYQYFHHGPRGDHIAWDSRCFDYGKYQVLHFLLSNCRFWLDEYHFDGFRFDGITSMLYEHHGLDRAFTSYDDYFDNSIDEDAYTYLALANRLIHTVRPDAVTIAEDISGMPGLAMPAEKGGVGFDYRFAMGVPDYWIRLTKDMFDEAWSMGELWYELTNRRHAEKTISYAESHDQALVGDQTLIFRLIGTNMYDSMAADKPDIRVDRGLALHKMIRLITLATAGSGYLNFMGNEFGHPEWIDFPRQGNDWSYRYARRQWRLADDESLVYRFLGKFDQDMLAIAKNHQLLASSTLQLINEQSADKILIFERAGLVFAFNFHPYRSYTDYRFEAPTGKLRMLMDSDDTIYGGQGRLTAGQLHEALINKTSASTKQQISLYLPTRTAIVLKAIDGIPSPPFISSTRRSDASADEK
ncbi:alpha amylase C-terminal domain-containing protein [Desulfococcaceae bacterium HSG9]|nr:alpha amylase C-terminal domain-containing protein [Desulfococcaceae bacterium HSG9]